MKCEIQNINGNIVVVFEGNIKNDQDNLLFNTVLDGRFFLTQSIIYLNLERLIFINSSALGKLVQVSNKMKTNGGTLKLIRVSPDLKDLFKITRLYEKFQFFEKEEDAFKPKHATDGGLDLPNH